MTKVQIHLEKGETPDQAKKRLLALLKKELEEPGDHSGQFHQPLAQEITEDSLKNFKDNHDQALETISDVLA